MDPPKEIILGYLYFKLDMLWHDDFFTLPNGETKPYFKMGEFRKRFIIQHPYFHFGSFVSPYVWVNRNTRDFEYETPIYFQQFEFTTDSTLFDFCGFLADVEKNCHLKPDEVLWFETGFWSILSEETCYMGMGLERLKKTMDQATSAEFALCLSNNVSIVLINSKMNEDKKIMLSIYASNDILPFAEVMEPFRTSIANYDNVCLLKSEMLLEEKIRRFWFAKRDISLDPVAFIMSKEDPSHKMLPVLKNEFRRTKDPIISRIQFLTGTTSGGFIESDYYSKKQFQLYAEIWELEYVAIVDFQFDQV